METFIKVTTIKEQWYLCNDIRKHIWDVSNRIQCHSCGKDLSDNHHISICFVRNKNLCFQCWHKKRWPKE